MKRNRAIERAKEFRERVLKSWQAASAPWPLSGLKQFPCERTVYVSLKVNETPNQLLRAVLKQWKDYRHFHGGTMAGIGNMISLIIVPTGEAFCSLRIARFPGLVGQTEAEMIPKVDKSVELLREFAAQTGRRTATIGDECELICSDGRRFLLDACERCNMMNDEISKKFKAFIQQDSAC